MMEVVFVCNADVVRHPLVIPINNRDRIMNNTDVSKPNDAFVVHRKISIPAIKGKDCILIIRELFSGINGIQKFRINVDKKNIHMTYDASQIGFGDIERLLREYGYPVSGSWWSRHKSGWYRYLDENARANAQSKGGACCSNPSDIYAKRHK